MSTKFCSYHFTTGCTKGAHCTFSHQPTIPRNPRQCRGCDDVKSCPFIHEGESWSQDMPPIVHPKFRMAYLEAELAATKKELEEVKKELKALRLGENSWHLEGEVIASDEMSFASLGAEIRALMEENQRTLPEPSGYRRPFQLL